MRRFVWVLLLVAVLIGAFAYVNKSSPPWYERIRYPLRYSEYVRVHAREHGLDPSLVASLGGELTPIEVVQLLVRFGDRIGAQLIGTGVRLPEQRSVLQRSGVELLCGELLARPDTQLPQVSFAE